MSDLLTSKQVRMLEYIAKNPVWVHISTLQICTYTSKAHTAIRPLNKTRMHSLRNKGLVEFGSLWDNQITITPWGWKILRHVKEVGNAVV